MQDSWTTLIAEKAPTNMTLHKELPAGKRYASKTRRAVAADAEVEGIQLALELLYECLASTYQERKDATAGRGQERAFAHNVRV
jgi:hypothetical protein